MILALGVTYADDAPRESVLAHPAHLAIVTAPAHRAVDGRARLALQVAHATVLPSFLPFKPRDPMPVEDALARVASAAHDLEGRLASYRGLVQYAVALTPPPEETSERSLSWLRRRAVALERLANGAACITAHLRRVGPRHIHAVRQGRLIEVIGDRGIGQRMTKALAHERLSHDTPALKGFDVSVTGPWPVFAKLDESASQ